MLVEQTCVCNLSMWTRNRKSWRWNMKKQSPSKKPSGRDLEKMYDILSLWIFFNYLCSAVQNRLQTVWETLIWTFFPPLFVSFSEQFFDYIAGRLGEFLKDQNLMGQTLPLGFSFSFPCKQEAIDKVTNTVNVFTELYYLLVYNFKSISLQNILI